MADSIDLEDGQIWGGASWVVRNVLAAIAHVIKEDGSDPKFARWLKDCSKRSPGMTGFDVRGLSAERRGLFFKAAQRAFEQECERGADGWTSPEYFDGYLNRFELLAQREGVPEYQVKSDWDGIQIDLDELWY